MVIRQLKEDGFGRASSCILKRRNTCNTCNTSPVIGVIHASAYTSIRELLLQVLRGDDALRLLLLF